MYLTNKYTAWYNRIIARAQSREIPECYTEKHHISPRSLGGDRSIAIVAILTAKEHFVCHLLLTKMVEGNARYKMVKALTMIMGIKNIGEGRHIANSRWFEYARESNRRNIASFWTAERRLQHSETLKKYNLTIDKTSEKEIARRNAISEFNKTKEWSEKALENRTKNMKQSADNRRGKPWTENRLKSYINNPPTQSAESNEKRRASLKGRKTSSGNLGHTQSTETKLKKKISNPATIIAWFISPANEEVLCLGINSFSKTNGLNVGAVRTLVNNTEKVYRGWKFLRNATQEERGT